MLQILAPTISFEPSCHRCSELNNGSELFPRRASRPVTASLASSQASNNSLILAHLGFVFSKTEPASRYHLLRLNKAAIIQHTFILQHLGFVFSKLLIYTTQKQSINTSSRAAPS
jgi:hypothetical protein